MTEFHFKNSNMTLTFKLNHNSIEGKTGMTERSPINLVLYCTLRKRKHFCQSQNYAMQFLKPTFFKQESSTIPSLAHLELCMGSQEVFWLFQHLGKMTIIQLEGPGKSNILQHTGLSHNTEYFLMQHFLNIYFEKRLEPFMSYPYREQIGSPFPCDSVTKFHFMAEEA